MFRRPRAVNLAGLAAILGGVLLLAYSQVSAVLPEVNRAQVDNLREGSVVSEVTGVVGSALLITFGALLILGRASRAPPVPRAVALGVVGLALPFFLVLQTTLVINGASLKYGDDRYLHFSASYLFHSGGEWSFAAVYILFFFTLLLILVLLGAAGYLLAPRRFPRALFDRANWAKNEAIHISAALFLLLSVAVLFYYLLRLAVSTEAGDVRRYGLVGQALVPAYYLLCTLLFAFGLTVAARTFLLNWGSSAPLELHRLLDNVRTIGRVERTLLGAAGLLNLIILLGPTLPARLDLSQSFAFDVSPRGLAFAFYLLLVPYLPYAATQRRLDFLLRAGRGPTTGALFAERSLRLVLAHVLALVLVLVIGAAADWDPLALMLGMSAWTAGVLLLHAVRVESPHGLPRLAFRGDAGPAYYFIFLGLALTTGLMLWGAGNTYEVTASFLPQVNNLDVDNLSGYGADVFARVAAAAVLAGSLVLTIDLWLNAYRAQRRFLRHYVAIFLTSTISALLVFTVGVWTEGQAGLENAYAGYAFHQYYDLERWGAGLLLSATVIYLFIALGRLLRPIVERSNAPEVAAAVRVRW